ncbi:MAG TPA: aminotransferase class V-fold PLP-dependent enzyme [Acidobacteriaceae bacterium]|nr:aminotransferase class V-fold PLP-dependent enzyme [Acidobacteriaceae bacterium]
MRRIYLDANATTPLLPEVFEAMRPYFVEKFGNASSIHLRGQEARAAVERARQSVADLLHCRPAEIVFTSGGTEGDNQALFGMVKPGEHLITSAVEHHAVLNAAEKLRERGAELSILPVDSQGVLDPDEVRRALRPSTRLISVMTANNETGVLQPVAEIGKIAAEADVYFHTDAVQAAGKIPLDVHSLGCDLLSIAGHKMHAPQGTGALFVRRGTPLEPLLFGGAHERQRRGGTENVPGIVGLGRAAELALEGLRDGASQRVGALRDRLEQGVLAQVEEAGIHGGAAPRVPNTSNLWFDHLEGEALVIALDLKGIAVSGGAACASGSTEPSHVLLAMGVPLERARASVRLSLQKQSAEDEIEHVLRLLPAEVNRLRDLSPVYARRLAAAHL